MSIVNPTVDYDFQQKLINVLVIVSPVDETDINIVAPPVTFPFGTWALIWNLVTTPGLVVEFAVPGITLPPAEQLPVTVLSAPSPDGGQWTTLLYNPGSTLAVFKYDIHVDWSFTGPAQCLVPIKNSKTIHDPTIAVVEEPIGQIGLGVASRSKAGSPRSGSKKGRANQ